MRNLISGLALAAALASATACNNGSSSSTTAPTSTNTFTDTVTGVVPAPINDVLQSSFNTFTVGQSGGTVTVILTSAIEKLPDGTIFSTNPVMGLAIGTPSASTCTVSPANPVVPLSPGANSGVTGTLNPGTFCAQVSDLTGQLGPVSYTLVIQHP